MGIPVEISGGSCIFLALLCTILPQNWLLAALSAAFFHEICHILAVLAVGGSIQKVQIGTMGAVLEASPMKPWQELLCTMAGPAGSLSLLFFAARFPKVAFCAMMQGLYNLLPVDSLDGGRILSCVTQMLFTPEKSRRICDIVQRVLAVLMAFWGIWGTFRVKLGLMPLFTAVNLLSRVLPGKIPCKEGKLGVQ